MNQDVNPHGNVITMMLNFRFLTVYDDRLLGVCNYCGKFVNADEHECPKLENTAPEFVKVNYHEAELIKESSIV